MGRQLWGGILGAGVIVYYIAALYADENLSKEDESIKGRRGGEGKGEVIKVLIFYWETLIYILIIPQTHIHMFDKKRET